MIRGDVRPVVRGHPCHDSNAERAWRDRPAVGTPKQHIIGVRPGDTTSRQQAWSASRLFTSGEGRRPRRLPGKWADALNGPSAWQHPAVRPRSTAHATSAWARGAGAPAPGARSAGDGCGAAAGNCERAPLTCAATAEATACGSACPDARSVLGPSAALPRPRHAHRRQRSW